MRDGARSARLTSVVVVAWTAAQGVGAIGLANADDARSQAARSFRAGTEAYARHDFAAAARSFDEAFRIAPRGAVAYNAGLAWENAGDRPRAADDYVRALEASDLGTVERADATGRLRALERVLGRLSFASPGGTRLTLDELELPEPTANLYVEPGPHSLRVQYRDGRTETRALAAQAGAEQSIQLGGARPEEPREPPSHGVDAAPEGGPSRETPPRTPRPARVQGDSRDRTPAWIAFGGAVVASGVAVYLFERGLSALHDFENGGSTSGPLHTDATNYRTGTWVAWGVAGALAVTGTVLYVTAGRDPSSPAVAVDGRGVTLHVPF